LQTDGNLGKLRLGHTAKLKQPGVLFKLLLDALALPDDAP
jgi:hypothetical protein